LQTPAPSPKPPSPTPYENIGPGESEPEAQPSPAPIKGVGRGVWREGGGAALPRPFPHKPLSLLALEVGAGSGAVVIALARELPELKWVAVDISLPALKVAQENARRHGVTGRIHFIQADLLSGLKPVGRFSLLAANLPYVTRSAWEVLPRGIWEYEPRQAIAGGEDGLDLLRPLAREAHRYLAPGGVLALEMDPEQTEVIREILRQTESYREIEIIPDYRGLARVVRGIRK
jgi:release factor glutamine methyltransferase